MASGDALETTMSVLKIINYRVCRMGCHGAFATDCLRRTIVVLAAAAVAGLGLRSHAGTGIVGSMVQDHRSTSPDVYMDESFEARDAIRRAEALARASRWEEAAAVLQETIERNGDRLAGVGDARYVSVRREVMRQLANWPPEGVAAWRRAFERSAVEALSGAMESASLGAKVRAWETFFPSKAAGERTDELAQRAIESGRFALARRIYETALSLHPDRGTFEAAWRAHLALTLAMSGDAAEARRLFEIGGDGLATNVRWMGRDQAASDVLAQVETTFTEVGRNAGLSDAPATVADIGVVLRTGCIVDEPGLSWRRGSAQGVDPEGVGGEETPVSTTATFERAQLLTLQPVVADDLLIVQRGVNVMAFQLLGGAPVWSTAGSGAQASLDIIESLSVPEIPVVADGRVYAAAARPGLIDNALDTSEPVSMVFCLDARDGRVLWRRPAPQYGEDHAGVLFDTAVLVRRDRLFIVGRKRRAFGFEDCYLYCLRAIDGSLEFRTHLGSASTGSFGYRRTTYSLPSAAGDLIFVCTSLGTVAAVHEDTGAVIWLRTYTQSPNRGRAGRPGDLEAAPWQFTAPLTWKDRLAVMAADGEDLLILDSSTGRLERKISREALHRADAPVGMRDAVLIVAGEAVTAYDVDQDAILWSTSLPPGEPIFGRGVVLDDRVLIPTTGHLCSLRLSDGARTDHPWDVEGEGGNLLALTDMLIVAGQRQISAYLPREAIWSRLRRRLAEAPQDVGAALEFTEAALREHEHDEAMSGLEEALHRVEALNGQVTPDVRRRFFQLTMTFAERLSGAGLLTTARRERLFTLASYGPPDAAAHVLLRLRFAEWYEADQDTARAIRLLQQILSDRSLRDVVVRWEGPRAPTASEAAERRIGELIERHGPDVYAPFEEQARRQYQAAATMNDIARMLGVADTYPHSSVAAQALMAAGAMLDRARQPLRAAQTLIRAYYRYPRVPDRADLIRRIADALERAGRRAQAYGWLTKGMRDFPAALIDTGVSKVTFAQYRERLQDARRAIEVPRPVIDLPLRMARELRFDEEPQILRPAFTGHPRHSFAHLFLYTAGAVDALDPRSGRSVWTAPREIAERPLVLLSAEDMTILATPHQVFAVDAQGRTCWTFGEPHPGQNDPNRDWEGAPMFKGFAIREAELVALRDDGQMTCLRLKDGDEAWQRRLDGQPGRHLVSTDDWVICAISDGSRIFLTIASWERSGEVRNIALDDFGPVTRLMTTFDGQLLILTTDRIAAMDPESGRVRWSTVPSGRVRESMIAVDLDGLCLSTDSRTVTKLSLVDGQELWRSTPLSARTDEGLSLDIQDGNVLVGDARNVYALDGRSGQLLWKGTTPPRPNLVFRGLTRAYYYAVDVQTEGEGALPRVFFYDHRNASGVLPRDGGAMTLPASLEVTSVAVLDHAMIVQSGNILHVWVDSTTPDYQP